MRGGQRLRRGARIGRGQHRSGSRRAALWSSAPGKELWCQTSKEDALVKALELGVKTFVFETCGDEGGVEEREKWVASCLESTAFSREELRLLFRRGGAVETADGRHFASVHLLEDAADTANLATRLSASSVLDTFLVSFDPESGDGWKVIPVENLIAAKGMKGSKLLSVSKTASEAITMLSVLEAGTDGVLLDTNEAGEISEVARFLGAREAEDLVEATVSRVVYEGMGDRACVDLCSVLEPGEGLLCGSFSRGLFLVHSECDATDYINSRPFRVNAGPVHSYVKMPNDRTAYLSELGSGDQVLVVSPDGQTRTATVGRMKIEKRPLVRVDAEVPGSGDVISVFLQNAETVKLVEGGGPWKALPVTRLEPGAKLLCSFREEARHTGILVEERIVEK
ncbi:3-dehydroquinate synthase [Chloropicon primus]|uniref:3-dehydroquinate synthase n=1 Tax=Chloropicon primus TaxID=1764295 RepID=A0A5B8MJU0_9CHLO|nr:3-dehydroquinate synthase [Chloropicon primus]|eukprot:QDZ19955.1 3-dehydroquinate synthase [Chloropicon primus]